MIVHDRTEKRAREILKCYVDTISSDFSEHVEALILVGSLSNRSYVEGPGRDIDVVTILRDESSNDIRDLILTKIDEIENEFNNDIPIAKTVYRLHELKRPFITDMELCLENKHLIEVITELQRIHESGIMIFGKNIIHELPVPSREEVILFNELGRKWSRLELIKNPEIQKIIDDPPLNILVQIVITNAFRHYYFATNRTCSNKHAIADKMCKDVVNYRFQGILDIAVKYKMNPDIKLQQEEYNELRKDYQEFRRWVENQSVDVVPYK